VTTEEQKNERRREEAKKTGGEEEVDNGRPKKRNMNKEISLCPQWHYIRDARAV